MTGTMSLYDENIQGPDGLGGKSTEQIAAEYNLRRGEGFGSGSPLGRVFERGRDGRFASLPADVRDDGVPAVSVPMVRAVHDDEVYRRGVDKAVSASFEGIGCVGLDDVNYILFGESRTDEELLRSHRGSVRAVFPRD